MFIETFKAYAIQENDGKIEKVYIGTAPTFHGARAIAKSYTKSFPEKVKIITYEQVIIK